jgi:ribose 1,5-bisphosphokinase
VDAKGWDLIGPGHFVLVVGPSGAGKDTVLTLVRAAMRHDDRIVFPRRVITRVADGAEDHDSLTDAQFEQAIADGAFCVWWSAHGHQYGIPIAADDAIRAGSTVICNVSRGVVTSQRRRYANVTVVLVTAPIDVLEQRLAARRRSSDGDLAKRIARADVAEWQVPADVIIDNVDTSADAAGKLIDALRMRCAC